MDVFEFSTPPGEASRREAQGGRPGRWARRRAVASARGGPGRAPMNFAPMNASADDLQAQNSKLQTSLARKLAPACCLAAPSARARRAPALCKRSRGGADGAA